MHKESIFPRFMFIFVENPLYLFFFHKPRLRSSSSSTPRPPTWMQKCSSASLKSGTQGFTFTAPRATRRPGTGAARTAGARAAQRDDVGVQRVAGHGHEPLENKAAAACVVAAPQPPTAILPFIMPSKLPRPRVGQ